MQKITASESLRISILMLEQRKLEQEQLLRQQISITYDSFAPVNFLRKMITDTTDRFDSKDEIIQKVAALISGYVSRKILIPKSRNPILRLAGLYVQYSATKFFNETARTIELLGRYLIKQMTEKTRDTVK